MSGPQNNALHQTGRGGVAFRSSRPVVEARPAGERECWADPGTEAAAKKRS